MQFESLANELLFDLFEFLDTAHLVRAFFGLNSRFNQLLYNHFRVHELNFKSIAKGDFDLVCQNHLPLIIDQVYLLRLSDDETPNLPELLLSRGFTLDRFLYLQSLSLQHILSFNTIAKIIFQCRSLSHLTHLNIRQCKLSEINGNGFDLFSNIWSIPKLTHCNLSDIQLYLTFLCQMSSVSSSMKHLSIESFIFNFYYLSYVLKRTPHLQQLCITIRPSVFNDRLEFTFPSIVSMRLCFIGSVDSMKHIFEKMSNLNRLTLVTSEVYLDGNAWEQLISDYLPKLKTFRLRTNFMFSDDDNEEEQVDNLLNTFRSSFWLEKNRWFVQCHWNPRHSSKSANVYTLPYAFNSIDYSEIYCIKSTCLDERKYWSFDHVQSLERSNYERLSFNNILDIDTRFPNMRCIYIYLPIDDNIWSCSLKLNALTSLVVVLSNASAYSQLQTILNQATRLYSLTFYSFDLLYTGINQLTSKSIRRLDLSRSIWSRGINFNNIDYLTFVNSPLGLQCEILVVNIDNREDILNLISNMLNLRCLRFQYQGDTWKDKKLTSVNDKLVRWLQKHLPPTCSVIEDPKEPYYIHVWISRTTKETFLLNPNRLISNDRTKKSRFLTSISRFCCTDFRETS